MTATNSPSKTVLLLIDIQAGFNTPTSYWGNTRSNSSFEANTTALLSHYRTMLPSPDHKIIHVHHSSINPSSPLHPPSPGHSAAPFAVPLESELPIIYKSVNSAFISTPLEAVLRGFFGDGRGGKLYVAGLTTDHCVSTSVRMAGNLAVVDGKEGKGEVVLIEDATATWDKGGFDAETVHKVQIASLSGEFARIAKTEEVLREWEALRTEST